MSLKRHLQRSPTPKPAPKALLPSLHPGQEVPTLRASTGLLLCDSARAAPSAPAPLPARPPLPPERLDRWREETKQEEIRTPSTAPCPACSRHPPPAWHRRGLPPARGEPVPLPGLPPAVSPCPGVLVTALSQHGTGKGAGEVPMGLPCRIPAGSPNPARDSRLLPAHAWHRCWHTPPPQPRAPHRALGTGDTDPPSPRKGQPAPQGERRDTHPAEREPRRRQESPEGESPGAEPPWRRRARPALTSGGDGDLRRPRGSPAQLGPAGGELLQREKGKEGKPHHPRGTPAPNHPSGTQSTGVGLCHGCTISGLGCEGKEAKWPQLPFRKVLGPLGASFSHSGSEQPPPSSP